MTGMPSSFWGKLRPGSNGRPEAWHPLADHCADVAACLEALLERTLLRRRLARLAGDDDLSPVQVARLCVLAALHDAGKFNHGFQAKAGAEPRAFRGHVRELLAVLTSETRVQARIDGVLNVEEIAGWGAARLLVAAIAHHGAPMNLHGSDLPPPEPGLWEPRGSVDPVAGMGDLSRRARGWFPTCTGEAEPFDEEAAPFQHAFSGLLTLADWIGSDSDLFPFSEEGSEDRMTFAREAARRAIARLGLDAPSQREALGTPPSFNHLFDFSPRAAQSAVLSMPVQRGGGLAVLEAETGSGKTEAAIARYLALFAAGEVDGMYFALPTRTAAIQLHRRVHRAVERAFADADRRPPVVLAVPGYVRVDDATGRKDVPGLPPFGVLWPEDAADRLRWRGWAAERPKRYLAGAVVVGTIDQVLLSTLPLKHAHLRAASLLRHLLVVDEVHASDPYMNRLLEAALGRHAAAGGHALLMSATLGSVARERFLAQGARSPLPPLADASRGPYPRVEWVSSPGGRESIAVGEAGNPKTVRVEPKPWMEEPGQIARTALLAAADGARVLVLRNTVTAAVASQRALEELAGRESDLLFRCEGVPAPHHSRYAREDRERLDHAIEGAFGKDRGGERGCVAVATQTVQQSLDLDADLLLTDLCPADVLLQRIGRLHRHPGRPRPPGFAEARTLLLVPQDRDLGRLIGKAGKARGPNGVGSVYADLRILEATWRLAEVPGPWLIPEMNRRLVERATHPEALHAIAEAGGDRWREHETAIEGAGLAKTVQAATNVFRWDQPFGDCGFATGVDDVVSTRLGAGDRLAHFGSPAPSPFAGIFSSLTVPAWLVRDATDEAEPEDVSVSARAVRFRFGSRELVYDRLGLRRATEQDREEDAGDA